jgi:hypothetical protein
MKLASQGLTSLSKRFSLLAVAGIAILAIGPDVWVTSNRPAEPLAAANSAEPARLVPDAGATVERVAYVSRRATDAKKAAKAKAKAEAEAEAKAKADAEAQSKAEADTKSKTAGPDGVLPPTKDAPQTASQTLPVPPLPEPAPPPPDVWSDAEVIQALKECVRLLGPIAAEIEVSEPLKKGECGAPAPVLLRSVGGADKVEFRPAVPLNCRMVVALHHWVEKGLQPAARELLGSPVTRISSGTYSCRNRYGLVDAAISEHAFANAIDISSFTTADGRAVNVLKHWGLTQRDIEAQRLAEAKAKAEAKAQAKAAGPTKAEAKKVVVLPKDPEGRVLPQEAVARTESLHELRTAQMKLGARSPSAPLSNAKAVVPAPAMPGNLPEPPQEQFLHRLHKSACGVFGTVLGPEANDAHRDHFHLDLAQRRSKRSYCH